MRSTKAFGLPFAHSLRYELQDPGILVTTLQLGPTNTDFFHRAGKGKHRGRIKRKN